MDRDEILALFARRAAAWQAHDARALALTHADNMTIRHGEIVHERRIFDFTGALVQIGVLRAKPA